jgi:hypothetical protein
MTMHLCGPALTLTGKKKGRHKFRNAEEARRARELAADWQNLKTKWAVPETKKKMGRMFEPLHTVYKLTTPPGRDTGPRLPSVDTGGPHVTAPVTKVYTGTKVMGIATLHKSNAVPVFSQEEAADLSRMRRG